MLLIGISGHKQSGKDTTVDTVRRMLAGASVPIERISLADPLKEELAEFLSSNSGQIVFDFFMENVLDPDTQIEIIQSIFPKIIMGKGVNAFNSTTGQDYRKSWFLDLLSKEEYLEIFNDPDRKNRFRKLMQWWGTDFRRATEDDYWRRKGIEAIKKLDAYWQGQCILFVPDIRFPDEAKMIKELGGLMFRVERPTTEVDSHPSETLMDNYVGFDYVLDNSGTLEQFYTEVFDKTSLLFVKYFSTL